MFWQILAAGSWIIVAAMIALSDWEKLKRADITATGAKVAVAIDALIWPIRIILSVAFMAIIIIATIWKTFLSIIQTLFDGSKDDVQTN